jgi:N-acetylneuraminate synthase
MIFDRDIRKYIVFSDTSILHALEKLSENKKKIVFLVNESGLLEGSLTDGDFRRWIVEQSSINLNQSVSAVANKEFEVCYENDEPQKIESLFSDRIEYIPIVDSHFRLKAVASRKTGYITIGSKAISDESPTFVIAEIGNNHNGSIELAKRLVDEAIDAGADCAKFQMRNLESLYANKGNANDASEDLGSQYVLDLLSRFQLSEKEFYQVFDYCNSKGIIPLCTPWDVESVSSLEKYGMQAYKVASADLTNHDLLKVLAETHRPLICSTGMATELEISHSVNLLQQLGAQYVLLHCNSTYPAPFKDINLKYMRRLREIGNCPVGYSGHERGVNVAIAAVANGAKVIEKHFTLDRNMEGSDHKVSLLPEEFKQMVSGIREVELSLGTEEERKLNQGEIINREALAKSLVINRDLEIGEQITPDMIEVRSPGKGLPPYKKDSLTGRVAKRNFKAGEFFYPSDINEASVKPRAYSFSRPFGIPVRYHDFKSLCKLSNLDLIEFHLSYKDLEIDPGNYLEKSDTLDFIVHAPELFGGDHLLDLCALDNKYREQSIKELARVVEVTKGLKEFFPKTKKPLIILNSGGFTENKFIPKQERKHYYNILQESLASLDLSDVEIIPQTMPPFPWHFGGQRFHNLFIDADEIKWFCQENNYRICFDVSHSKLACNYSDVSLLDFIEDIGPYIAHMHIADAEGIDGEGLQIGNGEIDFKVFFDSINKSIPNASFIPEIWQGHKNNGEGFWLALEALEKFK